jgi:glycosyltransferase involved in cell wall biosynthesis
MPTSNLPQVSIVIPVYNGSDYLSYAIDSALEQTYRNIEVLVINDGSNDGGKTERILESYGSRIRYLNKANGGVASALNLGVREMRGAYFSWLSHDDLYRPTKVEVQMEYALKASSPAIYYTDFETIDETGSALEVHSLPHLLPIAIRPSLMVSANIHGCSLLIPRKAFDKVGLFNEKLRTTQDYDLWFKMATSFPFEHIPEALVLARLHKNQGTHRLKDHVAREIDNLYRRYLMTLKHEEILAYWPEGVFDYFMEISKSMKKKGYRQAAAAALLMAFKHLCKERVKQIWR